MYTSKLFDILVFIEVFIILDGLRSFIEIDFLMRFLGIKAKPSIFVLYIAACYTESFLCYNIQIPVWLQLCIHFAMLFFAGALLLKRMTVIVFAPSIIAITLFTLGDGLSASIMPLIVSAIPRRTIWGPLFIFGFSFLLLVAQYYILKYVSKKYRQINKGYAASYPYLLLLPCLLTILTVRSNWGLWDSVMTVDLDDLKIGYMQLIKDISLLLLAIISFAVVLVAFYKFMEASEREAEKSNLEQQIKAQQQYVSEARQRNEQYRSFHHDIGNHFSVLSGLVSAGKTAEACDYLQKIKNTADETTGIIKTDNMVLDVLLGEKIAYAKRQGITVTWDMQFDKDLGIDDFDLCILFANAIDNAIHACMDFTDEPKIIQIISKVKNDFLFIEIENTCKLANTQIAWGTGLKNMQRTAEKYSGTLNTQIGGNRFRLSILLCLPRNRKANNRSRD